MDPSTDPYDLRHRRAVKPLRAIVVGAGITGLATAVALAVSGHSVLVLESVAAIEEVGAGLQLAPNCTLVLRRLGVLDEVMERASVLSKISIRHVSCRRGGKTPLHESHEAADQVRAGDTTATRSSASRPSGPSGRSTDRRWASSTGATCSASCSTRR